MGSLYSSGVIKMADYKKRYHKLFIEMNDTIDRFKNRLLEVEEIYTNSEENLNITVIHNSHKEEKPKDDM